MWFFHEHRWMSIIVICPSCTAEHPPPRVVMITLASSHPMGVAYDQPKSIRSRHQDAANQAGIGRTPRCWSHGPEIAAVNRGAGGVARARRAGVTGWG